MATTVSLKKRSDIHLSRKIYHFLGVLTVAIAYHNLSREMMLTIVVFGGALLIGLDVFRHKFQPLNRLVIAVGKPLMRDSEANRLTGMSYMIIGVFLLIFFFSKPVVDLSLYFLALADPMASYFGVRFGKDKLFGKKSLQGTLAAFFCCLTVATSYYLVHDLMTDRLVIVSLLSGLAGAIAEAIPVGKLDDNLVMPVASAVLLHSLFYVFGGFAFV